MKKKSYPNTIPMQSMLNGLVIHSIKVTYLGNNWYGCRCYLNGELNQEIQVEGKENIRAACRSMLRMEDKCGNISNYAGASRMREDRKEIARKVLAV